MAGKWLLVWGGKDIWEEKSFREKDMWEREGKCVFSVREEEEFG
jgi:hypothetical protein